MPTIEDKNQVRKLFNLRQIQGRTVHHMSVNGMAPLFNLARTVAPIAAMVKARDRDSHWIGFKDKETLASTTASGVSMTPLKYFDAALARIEARKQIGGRSIPAMAGGAWIIPKAIAGLPMAAMAKPRTRLPAKTYKFLLEILGSVKDEVIAERCAMIARAAWEYTLLGGLATVVIAQYHKYAEPSPDGAAGMVLEVILPLANKADLAYACSCIAYRGLIMGLASHILSPVTPDPLRLTPMAERLKGYVHIEGIPEDIPLIEKALAS